MSSQSRRRINTGRRGFTLVELLVAVMAGLFVSLAAFVLAKNAAYFFQHEARISSAQLSAMLGMERLLADIERASFLSTPNIQTSLKRCPPPDGDPVAGLPQSAANGMKPDRITIGGAFDTTEAFGVTDVQADGAGWKVHLDMKSHEMARTLAAGKNPADIFKAGRFLRFVDREARYEYFSIISSYDAASGAVRVAASPLMPSSSAMPTCGLHGLETGGTANPVARVRYDIRSLKTHPRYQEIVKPISAEASGDDGRTELVRVELDANDNEIADSLELIAEYAVDLKIGFTATTKSTLPPPELNECPAPALLNVYHCPIPMSSAVYQKLGGPVDSGALPELIQTVSVRLVTRARAPDRDADLTTGPDGRKLRFRIDLPGPQKPKYARLRTVYAEKLLRNQETP
jgi:prepilin-type N-terminal cleavage/methylation domain-containing protein